MKISPLVPKSKNTAILRESAESWRDDGRGVPVLVTAPSELFNIWERTKGVPPVFPFVWQPGRSLYVSKAP